jgi:hypothetical protein
MMAKGRARLAPAWSEGHSQSYGPSEGQARRVRSEPGPIQPENQKDTVFGATSMELLRFPSEELRILRRPVRNAG